MLLSSAGESRRPVHCYSNTFAPQNFPNPFISHNRLQDTNTHSAPVKSCIIYPGLRNKQTLFYIALSSHQILGRREMELLSRENFICARRTVLKAGKLQECWFHKNLNQGSSHL